MSRAADLLAELSEGGFKAKIQGGELFIRPVANLGDDLRASIRQFEVEIIREMEHRVFVPWNPGVKWTRNQWGVWEDNPDYQGSRFGRHRHRSQ